MSEFDATGLPAPDADAAIPSEPRAAWGGAHAVAPSSMAPPLDDLPAGADYRQLAPATRTVWVWGALIWWLVLGTAAVSADLFWLSKLNRFPWPRGVLGGLVASVLLVWLVWLAARSFAVFHYAIREWDVLIASGVLWRRRQSVPRMRIQHVDVASGPIDRRFGVVNLTMYTAGTGEADATIPGLLPEDAEMLRELLLPTERLDV